LIINVKNTIKNAVMVFVNNGSVSQSIITLNSGMMMKAEYIQKEENNRANIHLINGSVILNIDRDSISFDKQGNNEYIARKESGSLNDTDSLNNSTSNEMRDQLPIPTRRRRGGCCGG